MIRSLVSTLLIGAATIAAPALAAPFDGPYVGVAAGYNRDDVARRAPTAAPLDASRQQDGITLGAYAGYNKKLGQRVVIGGELGFSGTIDDRITGQSAGGALSIDPRYSFDISARAGVLADAKTLVYARGGYANSRVRTTTATAGGSQRVAAGLDGWQAGAGVERQLSDHVSARIEYRYSDFGRNGGRFDRHQGLIGISYNF